MLTSTLTTGKTVVTMLYPISQGMEPRMVECSLADRTQRVVDLGGVRVVYEGDQCYQKVTEGWVKVKGLDGLVIDPILS